MRHLRLISVCVALLAVALGSCSKKPAGGALLTYVPADTPYVFATVDPLPKAQIDAWAIKFAPLAGMYEGMIDDALAKLATEDQKELANRVATAVLQELKGKVSIAGAESLGFSTQAHSAIYGVGLVPVIRVELKDPAAFTAFIGRVEKRVGEAVPTAKIGDKTYWRFGKADSKLVVLTLLEGNYLIVSAIPKDASVGLVKQLFGVTLPPKSLADSGTLDALNKQYGFTPHGSGYIDMQRLAQAALDAKGGVEKEYIQALGEGKDEPATPECRQELLAMAANFPRATLGYTRMETNEMDMRAVLELKPDLAKSLAALPAPVPGLGGTSDAMIDFGMSLNVGKMIDFMGAQARAVAAAPYKCSSLVELNQSFAKMQTNISNPMAYAAAPVLKGFRIALTRYEQPAGAMPVIAGKLAIASDNPQTLIGMAQQFMPQVKDLKLTAGAAPVPLPSGIAPPGVPPTYVAINDKALGLSIGEGEQAGLQKFIGADPSNPPPALTFAYNGKFFELMAEQGMKTAAAAPPEQRAKLERSFVVMRDVYGKVLKRTEMTLLLTDRGIELRQSMQLN